jgi:hypothetical protein
MHRFYRGGSQPESQDAVLLPPMQRKVEQFCI